MPLTDKVTTVGLWWHQGAGRYRRLVGGPGAAPPQVPYPSPPVGLSTFATATALGARWGPPLVAPTPVTGYTVRVLSGTVVVVPSVALSASTLEWASGTMPVGSYTVEVRAVNTAGAGDVAVSAVSVDGSDGDPQDPTLPPLAPAWVLGSVPDVARVRVDWPRPAADPARVDPTGYRVELLNATTLARVQWIEPVTVLTHQFTVVPVGTYVTQVTPLSTLGDGSPRSSAPVTVGGTVLLPPTAPLNVAASLGEGDPDTVLFQSVFPSLPLGTFDPVAAGFSGGYIGSATGVAFTVTDEYAALGRSVKVVVANQQQMVARRFATTTQLAVEGMLLIDVAPAQEHNLMGFRYGVVVRAGVRIRTDRTVVLWKPATAYPGVTPPVPVDVPVRFVWAVDGGAQSLRLWWTDTVHTDAAPDATLAAPFEGGEFDGWNFGSPSLGTGTYAWTGLREYTVPPVPNRLLVTYGEPVADASRAAVTTYVRELLRDGTTLVGVQQDSALLGRSDLATSGLYSVRVTPWSVSGPGAAAVSNGVQFGAADPQPPGDPAQPAGTERPTPRPTTYPEFVLAAGDNTAALQAFLNLPGNAKRIVGSGQLHGVVRIPSDVQFLKQDAEIILVGEQQAHIRRHGSVTGTQTAVTSGMTEGSNVVAVQSSAGFATGDWVYLMSDEEPYHKPYRPGFLRRIMGIVTNTVELDIPVHRTCTTNRRMVKVTLAPPIEMLWTGAIRHRDWIGMGPDDYFVQQMHPIKFVLCAGLHLGLPGEPVHVYQTGAGFSVAASVGGEIHLNAHHIPDLALASPTIAHWGYGLDEQGGRQITYHLESSYTRHGMTTQHNTWISSWPNGVDQIQFHGETEHCRFIYNVHETMSTGVNTHEGGWNNSHEGVIRDTGMWGDLAENKQDPTGLFFRARRDHIGPAGLRLYNIATRTTAPWYAAITTAEKSPVYPRVFTLAEGPVYSDLDLTTHNTKAGIRLKQPSTIGPRVTIQAKPGYPGIVVEAAADGSRIVGPVTVRGGSAPIVGAQYISNSGAITWIP